MPDNFEIASLVSVAGAATFTDERLRERLAGMMSRAGAAPSASFPEMFPASKELEGAYRFFANPLVTPDGVLSSHFEATAAASAKESTVLVVHDTSTFSFDPEGSRKGLGRVRSAGQAFFGHVSLVITAEGTRRPLGIAALKTWIRGEAPSHGESARWLESVEQSAERLGGKHHLIHVMDREADDYELISKLIQGGHRFIIRLKHDRTLEKTLPDNPRKVSEAVLHLECVVGRAATLSVRVDGSRSPKQIAAYPSRSTRDAKLSVGARAIILERPGHQDKTLPKSLALNLVRVWETNPPDGEEPVEWLIVTNESIDTPEAILDIVDRYRARWTIEEFFKAIKTGCAYKERQLGDYEGLINALALFLPIACRLLSLRSEAQHAPDAPARRVLDEDELFVLGKIARRPLPATPTVRDVLLAIAALGGHLKRKQEPGWLTLSRGMTKLIATTDGYRLARLQYECDQR